MRVFLVAIWSLAGCAASGPPAVSVPSDTSAALTAPVCSDSIVAVGRVASLDSIRDLLRGGQWQNARLVVAERNPVLANANVVQRALIRLYPPELRDAAKGGTAMQFLVIDTAGVPVHKRLIASSGHFDLDVATARIVDTMRFSPALVGGCKAVSAAVIPIMWSSR